MSLSFSPNVVRIRFPRDDRFTYTFFEACEQGLKDNVTHELHKKNQDPNALDEYGYSGLSYACRYKRKAVMITLLNSGANINQLDEDGYTPLYHACKAGTGCFDFIVEKGGDFTWKTPEGETLAEVARKEGHHHLANQIDTLLRSISGKAESF